MVKPLTRPGSGLAKPLMPSPELAAIVGAEPLPRTAVVSRVWERGLQDPKDKRTIVADAKLRPVLGADRCTMFELSGKLSSHLKAA